MPQMRKLVTEGDRKTIYINADIVQLLRVAENTQNTTIHFGEAGKITVVGSLLAIAEHLQTGNLDAEPPSS
jgi:hypothetical protein